MIDQVLFYARHLQVNNEALNWIKTTGNKALIKKKSSESELEHILDFFVSGAAPTRLQKMSFEDAKRKAKEWSEKNQRKGRGFTDSIEDIELIHDFLDGTKIVRLKSKKALEREGFLMSHCVGGYSVNTEDMSIYSYRDKNNNPHATFEIRKNDSEILQIKGKGNGPIHPKYIHPILAFLKSINVNLRPSEMSNLGYYHVDKEHLGFLKSIKNAEKQLTAIGGEWYAHS